MAGEVHAVVGENGAGKSTLMKILAGAIQPDEGEIVWKGQPVQISTPHAAQRLGISIIYQEFNLIPHLSVAANLLLGREPRRALGLLDHAAARRESERLLGRLGVQIDSNTRVSRLSVSLQQMCEIAKALSLNADLIIMDEPSASLTDHELRKLFEIIRGLSASGVATIYISHRLEEIFQLAERVTVLRDGRHVATLTVGETYKPSLVRMMVGRPLSEEFPPRVQRARGDVALSVRGLTSRVGIRDVSFEVHHGEIVGMFGLVGAGRTEVARAIFGADAKDAGEVRLDGQVAHIAAPRDAVRHGIGFVTEDRKAEGLVFGLPIRENVSLPVLETVSSVGVINRPAERLLAQRGVRELDIRTPSVEQSVTYLSGGNQQKVILAKWLAARPRLVIFDEPTRGIDVGAKAEIYHLMRQLADQGTAILMISSELPEVLGMSDRILVMHQGRLAGELAWDGATEEKVMWLATGGE
jgi:ribose transport system ATP-binding protein